MSPVSIVTAVPLDKVQKLRGRIISKTTEEARFYFVEAKTVGFRYTTGFPALAKTLWPGNKPLCYSWFTNDAKGTPIRRSRLLFRETDSISDLQVPSVPKGGSNTQFTVNLSVADKFGAKAWDGCSVRVHRKFELESRSERDRNSVDLKPDIAAVSAPFPGGKSGITLTVSETSTFKRERTWSVSSKAGVNVEIPVNAIKVGFGVEVTEEFSSAVAVEQQQQSGVQSSVAANEYGIWYRLVQPYERHADVYMWDESGNREQVGTIVLTDYLASYYLGVGATEEEAHADARKRLGLTRVN